MTKTNAATGEGIIVAGRAAGTSLTTGGNTSFPGMPTGGNQLTQVNPRLLETTFPIPPVTTDRNGRFVVPDLEEGSYKVLVTKDGYVRQEYGQRVFSPARER